MKKTILALAHILLTLGLLAVLVFAAVRSAQAQRYGEQRFNWQDTSRCFYGHGRSGPCVPGFGNRGAAPYRHYPGTGRQQYVGPRAHQQRRHHGGRYYVPPRTIYIPPQVIMCDLWTWDGRWAGRIPAQNGRCPARW